MPRGTPDQTSTKSDSTSVPATGPTAPVDPAKGNALLKRLFSSKLPNVNEPAPPVDPVEEK